MLYQPFYRCDQCNQVYCVCIDLASAAPSPPGEPSTPSTPTSQMMPAPPNSTTQSAAAAKPKPFRLPLLNLTPRGNANDGRHGARLPPHLASAAANTSSSSAPATNNVAQARREEVDESKKKASPPHEKKLSKGHGDAPGSAMRRVRNWDTEHIVPPVLADTVAPKKSARGRDLKPIQHIEHKNSGRAAFVSFVPNSPGLNSSGKMSFDGSKNIIDVKAADASAAASTNKASPRRPNPRAQKQRKMR